MTDKEHISFIVNPVSGTGSKSRLGILLERYLDHSKYSYSVHFTQYRRHGKKLALMLAKEKPYCIVAVGGDGTVNEVASALVGTGIKLGILPTGSGNGLARELGIPVRRREAIELLNKANEKVIDCGRVNKRYFFCTCGVGFDAHVGRIFNQLKERGLKNYIHTILQEFFRYQSKKYRVEIDGREFRGRAFLITVANARQWGNNVYISPGASITDGLLDVSLVRPFPKFKSFLLGIRLINRTIDHSRYVELQKEKNINIYPKKKAWVHIDGESLKKKKNIHIRVVPAAVHVVVP